MCLVFSNFFFYFLFTDNTILQCHLLLLKLMLIYSVKVNTFITFTQISLIHKKKTFNTRLHQLCQFDKQTINSNLSRISAFFSIKKILITIPYNFFVTSNCLDCASIFQKFQSSSASNNINKNNKTTFLFQLSNCFNLVSMLSITNNLFFFLNFLKYLDFLYNLVTSVGSC